MVDVRRATASDAEPIMRFIGEHWQQGHPLSTSRTLFDWQYSSRRHDGYSFMLGWRDAELLGVLGYISTADLDPSLTADATVWLALWKVRDDVRAGALGLRLLTALTRSEPHAAIGVVGIGDARHPAMYRSLGYETGTCTQLVLFDARRDPTLARLPGNAHKPVSAGGDATFEAVSGPELDAVMNALPSDDVVPRKTAAYLRRRFVEHPFYDYRLDVVSRRGRPSGVLVSRVARHGDACAVRFVDHVGDSAALAHVGTAVADLVADAGAEHADLWLGGGDPAPLVAAGFAPVDPDGPMVVPNHFEPYVAGNGRIEYAIRSGGRPFVIHRADGDQDRPNRVDGDAVAVAT